MKNYKLWLWISRVFAVFTLSALLAKWFILTMIFGVIFIGVSAIRETIDDSDNRW